MQAMELMYCMDTDGHGHDPDAHDALTLVPMVL